MCSWRCVWFLSAMAATGYCLKCITCRGLNSDSCSISSTESCPEGYVCASQQEINIAADIIFQSFKRFCALPSECNKTGTFTKPHSAEWMATTCCSEDLCTPAKPRVPDQVKEPNGRVCPKCALMSESCESLDTMDCMGEETMCRLEARKQTTGSLTLTRIDRGCASEGLCFTRTETSTNGAVYKETTYLCTPGTLSNNAMPSAKTYTEINVFLFAILSFILALQNNVC